MARLRDDADLGLRVPLAGVVGGDPVLTEVAAAYRGTRAQARLTSTIPLRWQERRMARHAERLDQPSLASLAAIRDELRDRGHPAQ
jgi:hypothetical protein